METKPLTPEELVDLRADLAATLDGATDPTFVAAFKKVARLLATLDRLTTPTCLDTNDSATWPPEVDDVLARFGGSWRQAQLLQVAHPPAWRWSSRHGAFETTPIWTGDLWLPLPPTP